MNRHILSGLILAALAIVACVPKETPEQDPDDPVIPEVVTDDVLSITAGFESTFDPQDTKTHVYGGSKVYWSSGDDAIYVFDSNDNKYLLTSTESGPKPTRTFTGSVPNGTEVQYVIWTGRNSSATDDSQIINVSGGPVFGEDLTAGNGGSVVEWETKSISSLTTKLIGGSTLQVVNPQNINNVNSFAPSANIAVMKKGDTVLKNVFGYIRFTVPEGADGASAIKSVTFTADEAMAGKIQIDYSGDEPVAYVDSSGDKSITVNMRWNGSKYEAGTLFAVVPPGTYNNLKITVTPFSNGATSQNAATGEPFVLSSKRAVTVKRSKYIDCGILPTSKPSSTTVFGQIAQLIPKGTQVGGICVEGNYLYAGVAGQIHTYDISTPMSPVLKSSVSICGTPRQITVCDGKLYVSARESGVWIYSLTKPYQPSFVKRYDTTELATGIDVAGDCMFIGQRKNGVEFVDIRTPSTPWHIRLIDTDESQSVFYRDGYLYSGEWSGKITIFKASDLSNIQKLKTINLQGFGDGLWITGNRLYASTGHHHRNETPSTQDGDGHGLEIWDISDPENPTRISRTEFDVFYLSGIDYWLPRPSGDGKTIFCGDVYQGLYVVDAENEESPSIIEHYTLSSGSAVTSLALGTGVVYLATSKDGLLIMKCSRALPCTRDRGTTPTSAWSRYDYTTSSSRYVAWKPEKRGAVHSVASWGDALFVGCGNAGLAIVKVKRTTSWFTTNVEATTYKTLNIPYAGGVAVRGNKLYVSLGEEGIGVYSISDGPEIERIATITEDLSPEAYQRFSCWVSAPNDNYLVNGVRFAGYQFLAVGGTESNPTYTYRGSKSKNINYNKYISEQVCSGDLLPYATRDGLFWIDLSSKDDAPVTPIIDGIKSSIPCGVTNFKDGKALITADGKMYLVDSGASVISQTSTPGVSGVPRWDGSNTLILTNLLERKFHKVDVSNFESPTVSYTEEITGNPEPGIFVNGKAIIPCGYQGLLIEK